MNTINKKLLIFLMTIMFCQFQLINLKAGDTTIIDDEELPAIDPFSSGSSVTNQVTETDSQMTSNNGLLNNMRLVGIIIGENKKIAVFAAPDGRAFKYEENEDITDTTILLDIFKKGYSRIPVFSDNSKKDLEIVGILFVKELILLDPEDEIPVSSIINTFEHQILKVSTDYKLNVMLNDFCSGKGHIAIVKKKIANNMGLFTEKYVGILTLEDLLESILQVDIIDETDIALDRNEKDKYRKFDMNKLKNIWNRFNKPLLPGRKPLKIVFIVAACILILMLVNNILS